MTKNGKFVRTHNNGELRIENVGANVALAGWVSKIRNLGGLIFIDLRDRHGITQLVCKPDNKCYSILNDVHNEYVLQILGKVIERESKNKNLPTGDIEVEASEVHDMSTDKSSMSLKDIVESNKHLKFVVKELQAQEATVNKDTIKSKLLDLNEMGKITTKEYEECKKLLE